MVVFSGGKCSVFRDMDSLGVKYTVAAEKDKLFSRMAKHMFKILVPYEATVNLPFHERTGAFPYQLPQCVAKVTMAEVNKHRHLFPARYLTFHLPNCTGR